MEKEENVKMRPIGAIISIVSLLVCGVTAWFCYKAGILQSVDALRAFVERSGTFGVFLFILVQIVQVVIPILPGGISCLGGVLLFGSWYGFWWNYIGICIGSMIAFGITKALGRPVLYKLFPHKLICKYEEWTEKERRFLKLFAAAIFFPVAPDDFLCYLAGTTTMSWKQFSLVILLGKPFSIALYSLGLTVVFQQFFG